ncbi:transcriptional regulator with PAS, ATPase and Fis domain [Xanthobacter flavus]|uniref:Sigma-54-dependent Fis family transcriptional regulator n=1 Tax=Xanthobacter flavus TaxID=281 RepID=A0A9W6CTQ5_XANFL|nr:sigma 54-interacting transcriptional regulator [Xanthobacter flavus]MDR6336557.1 transcriptional regulator with PAS, ATPase and Fis domain [Xanthobacter flavus]GLI25132.1 sigma-54-dependent Fis family transcriptional regulator [Xanthobacter flavus]
MTTIADERFAAARALLGMVEGMIDGATLVDRESRVVWFSEGQLALLGKTDLAELVGQEIERVIPHSRMREVVETGHPHPLDIIQYGDRWLLVTRLPLRDETGAIIGAIAFALKDSIPYLRPIAERLHQMQSRLSRMEQAFSAKRAVRFTAEHILGASPAMRQLARLLRRAGEVGSAVLLLGETGTGKEMAAHAIHAASKRMSRPFVAINVAAVPENLLEAEFFGVAPGAFTGAARQPRPGKFQIAHEGTLFLDEIGDMPLALQAKLLRTLQDGEVEPVGSNQPSRVDVRIIAATSRPLADMVRAGTFRQDLYYRLNVLPIHLPPLRERAGDVELLATRFSEQTAAAFGVAVRPLTAAAVARLERHDWPGNVRELANVIEQIYVRSDGARIEASHVADVLPAPPEAAAEAAPDLDLAAAVARLERSMMAEALAQAGGNKREAAARLGLSRSSLYAKIRQYGMG